MRLLARLTLSVLALSLGACSLLPKKQPVVVDTPKVVQTGVLKVHPGLLGQPVPPELQNKDETQLAKAAEPVVAKPAKPSEAELLAKRNLYFAYKSAEVQAEDSELLAAHARRLAQNPKIRLRVEGNADERGSDGFNKQLGLQRAEAVKQALTTGGADAKQIKAVSLGKKKPKETGHDEASWAENRRADLVYEREE